jgi:hypothetical protein
VNDSLAAVTVPTTIGGKTVTGVDVDGTRPFVGVTNLVLPSTLKALSFLGTLEVDTLIIPKSVDTVSYCTMFPGDPNV